MAVRTDDAVSGGDNALLRQQRMLDAHFTHVIEVADAVTAGEFPALLGLLGGLDVFIGDEVVQDDGDTVLIKDLGKAVLCKFVDGNRGGDVIAQDDVQLCADKLSCLHRFQPRMGSKNLLRHCHSQE